ncbi:winged helix-turn-helix domain-containing protein [Rhizobium sp. AQ_MP]|uniref:winged helix-turn-helix domain-containing protein n=1 Tax=Rhizobium sp. AQ_MP TaxID=2761536 RepID=UPI00163A90C3|nr:helix-turn-helix domain-containing protein [Rhizobium sp. AQ_MP]MBC2774947.1 winged helix-turn-helix domain-containing protein [Rhizobium sp. AQ_MP]
MTDPTGRPVDLTAAEFDLLWAFCRNSGKTLSRQTLLTLTRVGAARPVDRSIDVHINRLRSKIEVDPHRPMLLRTVRLGGYIFTPAVEVELLPTRKRAQGQGPRQEASQNQDH